MNPTRCRTRGCDVEKLVARGLCSRCYSREYHAGRITPQLPLGHHSLSEIDRDLAVAVCAICGPTQIRVRKAPRGSECITKAANRRSKQERAAGRAYRKYGLTFDEYQSMVEQANGRCQICATESALVVDHDHATSEVRGLLCHACNVALGFMSDDPARLMSAAAYLIR